MYVNIKTKKVIESIVEKAKNIKYNPVTKKKGSSASRIVVFIMAITIFMYQIKIIFFGATNASKSENIVFIIYRNIFTNQIDLKIS